MFDLLIILKTKQKESLFITATTISSSWKTFLCVRLRNFSKRRYRRPWLPVCAALFWLTVIRRQRRHPPVRGVKAAGDEPQTQKLEVNDEVKHQLHSRYARCLCCCLDNIIKTTWMSHWVANEYQSTAENSSLTQPPCAPV